MFVIISYWETVIHDEAFLLWEDREHEVACRLEEVLFMSIASSTLVDIVSIDISAAFVFMDVDEIHLHDTIDRSIVCPIYYLASCFLGQFLHILHFERVTRSNAYHILCRAVVALFKILVVATILVFVNFVLLIRLVSRIIHKFASAIIELTVESHIRVYGTYITDIVGKAHIVAGTFCVHAIISSVI